jgi:predicted Zn-dependent protease
MPIFKSVPVALALSLFLVQCSTVPITGRSQLALIPADTMLSMSFQQYDEFLNTHKISQNKEQVQMVKKVGARIQKAVETYFAENGLSDRLKGYAWEFNLIEDEAVNAWAMPGGKVVVYTGLLPVARDETGLAVVMGHEIAHAIAGHGNERMTQALGVQLGGMALSTALAKEPAITQDLWLGVYGAGAQVGLLLPYSRVHESEADELGLIFMAMAGYNPNAAVDFWQRMAAEKQGKAPPEFLSTHPSDQTRIENIKKNIPKAMLYYRQ